MRIGIVTPAFNVGPYIGDTIRSVLGQSHPDWIMIVVDDGSTDNTAGVVRGFNDPRLSLISQANAGVSAARNRGATALDCNAMLFLDGDDRLAPFALDALASALSAAPDAVAAVGAYERGGRLFPPAFGHLLERLLVGNLFVNGGHVLIRRDAVPAFREDLRYGEDWEFWVRISENFSPPPLEGGGECFVPTSDLHPILHVRERPGGAYLRMSTDPSSFTACLDAIHDNPVLASLYPPEKRTALRRRAEAEVEWTIGRELIRHRRFRAGLWRLIRSLGLAPTVRRAALLVAIAVLPPRWRGPLYPYDKLG
jgi:glycosyltransferase involved in cell wall biosynthesis